MCRPSGADHRISFTPTFRPGLTHIAPLALSCYGVGDHLRPSESIRPCRNLSALHVIIKDPELPRPPSSPAPTPNPPTLLPAAATAPGPCPDRSLSSDRRCSVDVR